ncbi:MAG: N-acetylmuramoyl-L-alanine amidase [Thalassotalea sp.]
MSWLKLSRQSIAFFITFFAINFHVNAANSIDGLRVWPAPENTRVVFDLKNTPEYKYFTLSKPERLVIDFENTQNSVSLTNAADQDTRIGKIRTSTSKSKGTTRLVLELTQTYKLTVFPLAPAGQYGNRLVIDLYDKETVKAKPQVKIEQSQQSFQSQKRDIIIGIDAGHGGEDPGSIGPRGTYEKRVNLAIAKKLQSLINSEKGMKAVMIRSGDYYVDLDRRTELARKEEVDFLISIHADAFHTSQPSGASVWVVSNKRAESELARWLDNRQRNSELLGGGGGVIKSTNDDNLAKTLADMSREHSLDVSIGVSKNVISHMQKVTKMHKKTTQYKSLAVLKSSDIPSILVETGFISNHTEERNLTSSSHQTKLAKAIHGGIKNYFLEHPLSGSYFASIGFRKHKVSNGESLSVLAKRYNVSISQLKAVNNLNSNMVRIGQTLKIPRA